MVKVEQIKHDSQICFSSSLFFCFNYPPRNEWINPVRRVIVIILLKWDLYKCSRIFTREKGGVYTEIRDFDGVWHCKYLSRIVFAFYERVLSALGAMILRHKHPTTTQFSLQTFLFYFRDFFLLLFLVLFLECSFFQYVFSKMYWIY